MSKRCLSGLAALSAFLGSLCVMGISGCSRRPSTPPAGEKRIILSVPKPQWGKPRGLVLLSDNGLYAEGVVFGYSNAQKQNPDDYRFSWQFPDTKPGMGAKDDDKQRTALQRQGLGRAAYLLQVKELRSAVKSDPALTAQCEKQVAKWNAQYSYGDGSPRRTFIAGKRGKEGVYIISASSASADGNLIVGSYYCEGPARIFVWQPRNGCTDLFAFAKVSPEQTGQGDEAGAVSADGKAILFVTWQGGVWLYDPNRFTEPKLTVSGTIKAVKPGKWTLSVTSITTPDGKTTRLSPARKKAVLVPKGITLPLKAKVGTTVRITGTDGGVGKPLTAVSVASP